MSFKVSALVCALATLVTGCASVKTKPDIYRTERHEALTGIPYNLPMRQFGLKISRSLKSCPDTAVEPEKREIAFDVTVTAEPVLVAGERYVVDYRALRGMVKTSDFAVETFPIGTLKSVNVSAEDKSDQVLKGIVKTATTVASFSAGAPGLKLLEGNKTNLKFKALEPDVKAVSEKVAIVCKASTIALLSTVAQTKAALKTETEALAKLNKDVENLALAGAVTDAQKAALIKLLGEQGAAGVSVEKARKAYAEALDAVTVVETRMWPDDFADGGANPLKVGMSDADAQKLADLFEGAPIATDSPTGNCAGETSVEKCIGPEIAVFARLERRLPLGEDCQPSARRFNCLSAIPEPPKEPTDPNDADAALVYASEKEKYQAAIKAQGDLRKTDARDKAIDNGLFIRPPELGRILVCRKSASCGLGNKQMLLVGDWVAVPQLGQLRRLPFRNRMFESNVLVVQLAADGSLEKFQYAEKAAPLSRAVDVAAESAAQYKTARKDAREELAAIRAENVASITAQINEITEQKKLDALLNPSQPAEDPLKEAQLELLRAQAQLNYAQAELAARTTP